MFAIWFQVMTIQFILHKMDNLMELLKLAQNFEANETISIAKGKFQFPKNFQQIIKKSKQWRLKK